jgi:asparagine synthase (glutamine-hydrolysing)
LHLFQKPTYANAKIWHADFSNVAATISDSLTLDVSAIMAILSFNYTTGDRTLFNEIKRQPWLSSINEQGDIRHEPVPPHGLKWDRTEAIARKLFGLLLQEAEDVCRDRQEIYLLLSGGLDSRIVAGVIAHLYKTGKLRAKPIGVTWGLERSRDVHYARTISAQLGFDWTHIPMGPVDLWENIHEGFPLIGGLVSSTHLHAMRWFRNVSRDALVLAGSYGDSVGRAEFSGRHLLELDLLRASNPLGLVRSDVMHQAQSGISGDDDQLARRIAKDAPKYVQCEHQMQGFYMRNMIAHAMSIINRYCTLYQMFTAPQVYGYLWSLHPARRDDTIYAALLENHLPELARQPWARTNRALRGKTVGAEPGLLKEFHNYSQWCSGPLYHDIKSLVEPGWLEAIGIFNADAVKNLNQSLAPGSSKLKHLGNRPYDIWLWLAGFKVFYERLISSGKEIEVCQCSCEATPSPQNSRSTLRQFLSGNPQLYKVVSKIRRWAYKRASMRSLPLDRD